MFTVVGIPFITDTTMQTWVITVTSKRKDTADYVWSVLFVSNQQPRNAIELIHSAQTDSTPLSFVVDNDTLIVNSVLKPEAALIAAQQMESADADSATSETNMYCEAPMNSAVMPCVIRVCNPSYPIVYHFGGKPNLQFGSQHVLWTDTTHVYAVNNSPLSCCEQKLKDVKDMLQLASDNPFCFGLLIYYPRDRCAVSQIQLVIQTSEHERLVPERLRGKDTLVMLAELSHEQQAAWQSQ
jgi:hypothetical protein